MINHYEVCYLVPAHYSEEELVPIREQVRALITKQGGAVTFEENMGKKKLAYPIDQNHQGYYLLFNFDLEGEKLKDLDRSFKLTNEVLRHIIVKRDVRAQATAERIQRERIQPEKPVEPSKPTDADKDKDKGKIKLEDLDQRLDEILEGNLM